MTYRLAPRKGQGPAVLVGLTVVAAVVAILPIAAAIWGGVSPSATRTAFASAPSGAYVVGAKAGELQDTVVVAPAADPGAAVEIATIDHVPGHPAAGAVSPDGRSVALVVADAGSQAQPGASLLVVALESGEVTRRAVDIDLLQPPVWAADSSAVVVTRSEPAGGTTSNVALLRVPVGGGEPVVEWTAARVLGAYPFAFDAEGRLLAVVIDGRGSTLVRAGTDVRPLSAGVTRDWRLSPDGTLLAFIESSLEGGLQYRSHVVAVEGGDAPAAAAQAAGATGESLGAAWAPSGELAFGHEPGAGVGEVSAQSAAAGFDVPLAYAPDGSAIAVQAWTGASFDEPGAMTIVVAGKDGRQPVTGVTRFYGWATR
ncbi:MAG: hypothetical protein IT303_14335 [Dehalococcoidia bacterium]|nr:hypothetical protein [Dehalococcoidia bacterium]